MLIPDTDGGEIDPGRPVRIHFGALGSLAAAVGAASQATVPIQRGA